MKFLLDANIPYSTVEIFPKNHKVFHVRDLGLAQATDERIIAWAKRNKAVLITRDLDFANIFNFPPKNYFGIVVIRTPYFYSAKEIKRILNGFIAKFDLKTLPRAIVIVEEGRIRIRK